MTRRYAGLARLGVLLALSGGLVVAAARLPGTVELATPALAQSLAPAALVPAREIVLACPGPETEGIAGVPAVPGVTTVHAATAPPEALAGIAVAPGAGTLAVRTTPEASPLAATDRRGLVVSGTLTGAGIAEIAATGSLAPGTAALQTALRSGTDDRGLVATACLAPRAEHWLLAGGGESSRRERLVVVNPGANALTVDVAVHGEGGRVLSAAGSRLAVPPHGRTALLVDALAPGERTPAVHVVATGGLVTAVLEDSWIDAAVGRGRDDVGSADGPGTDLVVPAAVLAGPARVRVVVPGDREAVVQARLLTPDGPLALPGEGVLRVPAGSVRDLDLAAVAPGAYALQVKADRPILAAVMAERRPLGGGQSDLAWVAAAPALQVLGGSPVPPGTSGSLVLAGTGSPWAASVVRVAADGVATTVPVAGPADSTQTLDVSGAAAVWVRPTSGVVRAGLALEGAGAAASGGPLLSLVGLAPAQVSATQVPVVEIRR